MGTSLLTTALVCVLLMAGPWITEATWPEPGAPEPEVPERERIALEARRRTLEARLHSGPGPLAVVTGLRELARAHPVEIISTDLVSMPAADHPGETLRVSARAVQAASLLHFAEAVASAPLPVCVESVELSQVTTARTPFLRLGVRLLPVGGF